MTAVRSDGEVVVTLAGEIDLAAEEHVKAVLSDAVQSGLRLVWTSVG